MTITVEQLSPNQPWTLWVTGPYGGKAIAGPRLLRGAPWPDIRWSHETKEGAEGDARKLQGYLNALPKAKKTKKKSSALGAWQD